MMSFYIARVLGPFFFLIGLAIILHIGKLQLIMKHFISNRALMMYAGAINLLFALMIIAAHNYWDPRWYLVITLIGWLVLFKALFRLFFPEKDTSFSKKFSTTQGALWTGWVMIIVGVFLVVMGYFNGF